MCDYVNRCKGAKIETGMGNPRIFYISRKPDKTGLGELLGHVNRSFVWYWLRVYLRYY